MSNYVAFTTDHLAVTTLRSPNSAARSDVDIMNAFGFEFGGATDVVDVVRVPTVDDDVVCLEDGDELIEHRINECGGYHEPNRARRLQFGNKTVQRCGSDRPFSDDCFDSLRTAIVNDAFVSSAQEA